MTELEQVREVLRDLLEEKGLPQWLADIATEREALVAALDKSRTADSEHGDYACCGAVFGPHDADCETQRLLRLLDPAETQRQVDETHGVALREEARRNQPALTATAIEILYRYRTYRTLSVPDSVEVYGTRFTAHPDVPHDTPPEEPK